MENENPGCLGYILQKLGLLPKNINSKVTIKLPYALRDDFLSDAELSFYKILEQVVGNKVTICPKVSLKDIFFVTERDRSKNSTYMNKINRKHVDFLLCNTVTMKPLCGIELDDTSHNRQDRVERDIFVNDLFNSAGLQLVRFQNKRSYTISEIEDVLLKVLSNNDHRKKENDINNNISYNRNIKQSEVKTPICPKCGAPMVLREAMRGDHKGEKFYGCSNYPKCREKMKV